LIEAKNDSESALSQHWPVRPAERVTWEPPASTATACGARLLDRGLFDRRELAVLAAGIIAA
jgi:vacuolar-type H+-ATPase catalytic subunit A/Vma1